MIKIKKFKSFLSDVKHLKKKYKKIELDLIEFQKIVSSNPTAGIDLGYGLYKLRLTNSSKNKGKRAGFRTIHYFKSHDNIVYAVSMYDKSEIENISIERLIEIIQEELEE